MIETTAKSNPSRLQHEVARRRTFAIISHPDAGKTTLTEKLLLYGSALELAGAVRSRKNQRHATSDWMAMEQERGISITSTVLQFEYRDRCVNLLDTPGHQDFSEDTYRTLMAVDSAVMVIDAAKGIEPQTKKLFEACRLRRIPILTFINKLDQPAQHPIDLLDEIEKVLGIPAAAMNWPIGDGSDFQGVFDLKKQQVLRFSRTEHGQRRAPVRVTNLDDPELSQLLGQKAAETLYEEVELMAAAGNPFAKEAFLSGDVTPVYFGSALNNFGVEPFLDALISLSPAPPQRRLADSTVLDPTTGTFSGFIFKIQANMNPKHRDSIAFLRICSGTFAKDMVVTHPRLKRNIRLTRPYQLFAQGRTSLEEAFPGDVVGLANPGLFVIGDSVYTDRPAIFPPLPRFEPEFFAYVRNQGTAKHKQFRQGIEQLEKEGAIQRFHPKNGGEIHPLLAAVGQLQFDVVVARLRSEYGVEATIDYLPHSRARRIVCAQDELDTLQLPSGTMLAEDGDGQPVALFSSEWEIGRCEERNPTITLQPFGHALRASTWSHP